MVTNIIRRSRPTKGSINRPTLTVPEVHRQARQATVVICQIELFEQENSKDKMINLNSM